MAFKCYANSQTVRMAFEFRHDFKVMNILTVARRDLSSYTALISSQRHPHTTGQAAWHAVITSGCVYLYTCTQNLSVKSPTPSFCGCVFERAPKQINQKNCRCV